MCVYVGGVCVLCVVCVWCGLWCMCEGSGLGRGETEACSMVPDPRARPRLPAEPQKPPFSGVEVGVVSPMQLGVPGGKAQKFFLVSLEPGQVRCLSIPYGFLVIMSIYFCKIIF